MDKHSQALLKLIISNYVFEKWSFKLPFTAIGDRNFCYLFRSQNKNMGSMGLELMQQVAY